MAQALGCPHRGQRLGSTTARVVVGVVVVDMAWGAGLVLKKPVHQAVTGESV